MTDDEIDRRVAAVRQWFRLFDGNPHTDDEIRAHVGDVRALLAALDRAERERDEARGGTARHECAECGVEVWLSRPLERVWCGACTCQRLEHERDEWRAAVDGAARAGAYVGRARALDEAIAVLESEAASRPRSTMLRNAKDRLVALRDLVPELALRQPRDES